MLFYYSLKQLSNHRSVNMGDKDKIKKGQKVLGILTDSVILMTA